MIRIIIIFFVVIINTGLTRAQVGIGTSNPEAVLDVVSTNNGLLIPNISLNSVNDIVSVINPNGGALTVGTMVYNDGAGSFSQAGYYYWNGSSWTEVGDPIRFGMQFYSWDTAVITRPDINNTRNILNGTTVPLLTPDLSGVYLGNLEGASAFPVTDPSADGDGYSICFKGTYTVQNAGDFTISITSNDGSRLYIDGVLIIDNWLDQLPTTRSNTINLARGEHRFEFWYYEQENTTFFSYEWGANPDGNTGVISANQFKIK